MDSYDWKETSVPTFIDIHTMAGGVSPDDVAKAHQADIATQDKYGVSYRMYWVDEKAGKIFASSTRPTPRRPTQCIARRTDWWPKRSTR